MAKLRESWREKLQNTAARNGLPKVVEVDEKMSRKWGTGTCVIPSPLEVEEIMKSVPAGRVITINGIRERLAKKHGAGFGCPITTGIFAGIVARAAEEDANDGKTDIAPYWRTLKGKGELNDKYPGGLEGQAQMLEAEGHIIEMGRNGRPKRVKDWESKLVA